MASASSPRGLLIVKKSITGIHSGAGWSIESRPTETSPAAHGFAQTSRLRDGTTRSLLQHDLAQLGEEAGAEVGIQGNREPGEPEPACVSRANRRHKDLAVR